MNLSLLEVKNLSISYNRSREIVKAVRNVSFSLAKGENVAIVGESGCGKSTLARALVGLNSEEFSKIDAGEILYLSSEKREISIIFQDSMASLNPTMKVGNQVLEGLLQKNRSMKREEGKNRVYELFHWVGLSDVEKRYNQYPHELSGGMRQRVMIALSLALEPKILVADEPTTALDVTIQAQILDLFKKIQKDFGMSILFITHDLNLALQFCSRILVMYAGSIVESATTEELIQNPSHPYTKKLFASIPSLDLDPSIDLASIPGAPPSLSENLPGCPFFARCEKRLRHCMGNAPPLYKIGEKHHSACHLEGNS